MVSGAGSSPGCVGGRLRGHQRLQRVEQPEVALRPHRGQRPPQPGLVAASWRRRPAAPAPGLGPARRAVRRAPARTARRAPRRRAPPREPPASCRNSSSTHASSEMPNAPSDACSRLRILRVVTRIWCTESYASARTARSHTSSSSTCSATARCTGSAGARARPRRGSSALRRRRAPAPASNRGRQAPRPRRAAGCSAGPADRARSAPSASSSSHSRHRCSGSLVALGRGHDLVVAELRHRGAVGVVQHVDRAAWSRSARPGRPGDRGRSPARRRSNSSGTVSPSRVAERRAHLGPGVRPCGQLEVPAGVGAPGAAAQGDAVGGEIVVRRVEVDGVELLRRANAPRGRPTTAPRTTGARSIRPPRTCARPP